tara:strand:+ start:300 stop:2018 length:1719 start_codon:yes stop_codon:yes gene_type:complete
MSKNSADIRFIGFNKYTKQVVKEDTFRRWVLNGKNNANYKYIIDMYNASTTNKAINNAYIDLAYGRGLAVHDDDINETILQQVLPYFPKKEHKAVLTDNQIFGEHAFQIHRQKGNKNKLAKIEHIEKYNVIPSIEDEEGNIRSYWYSRDWQKNNEFEAKYLPKQYPAFGFAADFDYELPEIYVGRPYTVGTEYFSTPDYDACLQYASIEQEISNYYDSHIKNGLSFGTIINVPNSRNWDDKEKNDYIDKVNGKLSGSSSAGGKVFAFLSGEEPTTISNVENNTAHKQWDFLTKEASSKIISGHKCMSPMLVGLGVSTGFSSTADEMDMMERQLMKRIIAPKQDFVLDSLEEIFAFFGMEFDLYFRPLTEIEGENEEESKVDDVVVDNIGLSKKKTELEIFLEKGEVEDLVNYNIVDENEVDYNEEINLTATISGDPNKGSIQDSKDILIRYRYVGNKTPERSFCKDIMNADKVYRKEDIVALEDKPINKGFGLDGIDTYSIWKWKGGGLMSKTFPNGTCKHKWNRVIYLRKGEKIDVSSPLAELISTSEARRRGFKVPTNENEVSIAPHDMK